MKRLIPLILLCLIPTFLFAGSIQDKHKAVIAAMGAGGGDCSTSTDEELIIQNTEDSVWQVTNTSWIGQQIILGSSSTFTGIMLYLIDSDAAGSLNVEVWTDVSDEPGILVSGATANVNHTLIPATPYTEVFWEFATPVDFSSGTYHIVIWPQDSGVFGIKRNGSSVYAGVYNLSTNQGSSWTSYDRDAWFEVWGCLQ